MSKKQQKKGSPKALKKICLNQELNPVPTGC